MDAILDKSAFARIRLQPSVAAAISSGVASGHTVLRSLLVQRTEICMSARNSAEYEQLLLQLGALELLDSDSAAVRTAAAELQRRLVRQGTHRGPQVIDLIIAATALVHSCLVLHYDSDYDLLAAAAPELQTRWVVPRGSVQ